MLLDKELCPEVKKLLLLLLLWAESELFWISSNKMARSGMEAIVFSFMESSIAPVSTKNGNFLHI